MFLGATEKTAWQRDTASQPATYMKLSESSSWRVEADVHVAMLLFSYYQKAVTHLGENSTIRYGTGKTITTTTL